MLSLDKPTRTLQPDRGNPVFVPPFAGAKHVNLVLLDEIIGYVDRRALFRERWHLVPNPGETQSSFADRSLGLFQERMLAVRSQDLLDPKVAYGFYPVNSVEDCLVFWEDDSRKKERLRLRFSRSTADQQDIADLFKPVGEADYAAVQATTLGNRISSESALLYAGEMRQRFVDLFGLAQSILDAFDEYWHRRIRYEWGFGFEDGPSLTLLFEHFYRGERYRLDADTVVGPDMTDVLAMLGADGVGVRSEGPAVTPELTSVSVIAHHPRARPLH